MPPKRKFSKEEITEAALNLVSARGEKSLTARELGKALGCSARPLFTAFKNMKELQKEVRALAMKRFESFETGCEADMPTFKRAGIKTVEFAKSEPKLFALLFMKENGGATCFEDLYSVLGDVARECELAVKRDYGLNDKEAKILFETVWIYTFGIGVLCATGACKFEGKRLSDMLTFEFESVMSLIKSGKLKE